MFPGMVVYLLLTNDGAKTWVVSKERKVFAINTNGARLDGDQFWHLLLAGDNRLFRSAKAANKERVNRNRRFSEWFNAAGNPRMSANFTFTSSKWKGKE